MNLIAAPIPPVKGGPVVDQAALRDVERRRHRLRTSNAMVLVSALPELRV